MSDEKSEKLILWFSETSKEDTDLVGGKAANLGELKKINVPVPNGFTVTINAYFELLSRGGLKQKIETALKDLDVEDSGALQAASKEIETHILASPIPDHIRKAIVGAYRELSGAKDCSVAIRSSATAEDLPDASFAGQQETYLSIKGKENVLKAVQKCWASLFTSRAIFYRESKGFKHMEVGLAVPIQKMVKPETSGVLFTLEPLTNNPSKISIEAVFGTGEGLVQGSFTPDSYIVNKNTLEIEERVIAKQPFQVTAKGKVPVSKAWQEKQKLADNYIKELAKWGIKIEDHYQHPQDIEWVFSGEKVWIVQTRPVTTVSTKELAEAEKPEKISISENDVLLEGVGASPGVGTGVVKKLNSAEELAKVKEGDILVTEMTNPDFVPAMKRAAAIITDKGGKTSHAAIVSRELGIPCIVGTETATKVLSDEEPVTVVGEHGKIYKGRFSTEQIKNVEGSKHKTPKKKQTLSQVTATNLYVNLGQPDLAKEIATKNVDGVGLLRAEFMFAEIGKHPRALVEKGQENKLKETLSTGISKIAKAFDPRPVVYRTSDLKTNEYHNLEGGEEYEKEEANPMLGFRGAARYIEDAQVFKVELEAVKKARQKQRNVWIMIPFVRTPEELTEVKKIMSSVGLHRNSSFKLWLMVEIPSNVILLEKFIGVGIDGVSIGSNDLTQLTLGVDRDNAKLADLFDERNEAVQWMIQKTIQTAAAHGISSSICGQAPTLYPQLVRKLVRWGITSISVSPDAIEKTREIISNAEKEVVGK
ncbi:MAG: phosphoenolpyruvate synthase [Patescibacteria group bacterium]|nr:phosphoenolpyruvate synthase [Patescibacteria group bacterium]